MSRLKEIQDFINGKWMRIFLGSFAIVLYTLVVAYISVSLTSRHFHNELEKAKPKLRRVIQILRKQSSEISRLRRELKNKRPSVLKNLEKTQNQTGKKGEDVFEIIENALNISESK